MADDVIDLNAARDALKRAEKAMARERNREAVIEKGSWEEALLVDDKGNVDRHAGANVTMILSEHAEWCGAFYFDTFAEKLVIDRDCPAGKAGEEWADHHDKLVSDWLEESKYRLKPSKASVFDSVNVVARSRSRNPVQEYLRRLKWDGRPRVNLFATKYLGARPGKGDGAIIAYLARVSAILLIGPVARAMRPGTFLKTVPILEGPQDLGKSRAVAALCPCPTWFSDSEIPIGTKDAYQGLTGKWIIEIAEIDKHLRQVDHASTIKAFISSPSDHYRGSYERRHTDHPRQGAFFGTTNKTEYLKDETGGARWLPFTCGALDIAAIERDRDQLWAEAFERFQKDEKWWIEPGDPILEVTRREQNARYEEDVWTERVKEILEIAGRPGYEQGKPPQPPSTTWILEVLGIELTDQDSKAEKRVAGIMRKLGYANRQVRLDDGTRPRRWVR